MRRFLLSAVMLLAVAVAGSACDDRFGPGDPLIARDSSVLITTPTSGSALPTAIDFSQLSLRRPEVLQDALQWDFALRSENGALRLVPNPFDIRTRRPLITRSTQAFDRIERAPTARSAYGDTAITLQEGAVYVVRTRHYPVTNGFCWAYAKMRVVDLDTAAETAEFDVKANVGCADDRLEAD